MRSQDLRLTDYRGLTVVYKLHGGFGEGLDDDVDTLVVTESDYVRFLAKLSTGTLPPNAIATHILHERRMLFLGYSLADWNMRVILHQLNQRRPSGRSPEKSWGVRKSVPPLEKVFWEKRDVVLYDMDLADFVTNLYAKLIDLRLGGNGANEPGE